MYEQLDLFQFISKQNNFAPGDWIEKDFVGKELSFDEITNRIGELIVIDQSTQSTEWYNIVLIERIIIRNNLQRRLVYYDGCKQRGLIDERWFDKNIISPAKAYELKDCI